MNALPENRRSLINGFFKQWNSFFPTVGLLSLAAFFIALFSGIALSLAYDVHSPYTSLQMILLTNTGAVFFRNIHYWSAQLFLIFIVLHTIEHLALKTERKLSSGVWLRVVVSIPFIFFVMLSGFLLKGDSESLLAGRILGGLLKTLPILGDALKFAIIGATGDFQVIYLHHLATTTILILLVTIEHAGRIWPNWRSVIYLFSVSIILSFTAMPSLHDGLNPVIKGPWYFWGLQETLHWATQPVWIPIITVGLLAIFYLLPKVSAKTANRLKSGFFSLLLIYMILTVVGWLFRGPNWDFIIP